MQNRAKDKHEFSPPEEQVALTKDPDQRVDEKNEREEFESVDKMQRETWQGRFDFILSCVGYCIGLGNVWRFSYLCYKNGGGAFLVLYLFMVAMVGLPMYFLELAVGQYHRRGVLGLWTRIPVFKGVGYSVMIVPMWCSCYYPVVMAWALWYLFHSFTTTLPWSTCDNEWNTHRCVSMVEQSTTNCNMTNTGALAIVNSTVGELLSSECGDRNLSASANFTLVTSEAEFWIRYTLRRSDGINNMGQIHWQMALLLLLVWAGCYFCIWKGIRWSGKVVYVTAILPYIIMTVLLVRAVTLPGAGLGIRYYLYPNPSRLLDSQVWVDAASQVFFSIGVGYGATIVLGSYNKFHTNVYAYGVAVPVINAATSIFCGFAIFSILGFQAHTLGKTMDDVMASGHGLAFIAYPSALAQLPWAPFWASLFFLMLVFVGLDTQFCMLEGFFTSIVDEFPGVLRKRREVFIAVVCALAFLLGLPMVFQGGIYVFELFEWYAGSRIGLLFIVFFETVAFGWFYGRDGFYDAIEEMIGYKPTVIFKYCWRFIIPGICLSVLIFSLVTYKRIGYEGVIYPEWTEVVGWLLTISCIVSVPVFAAVHLFKRVRQSNLGREDSAEV